MAAKKRLFSTEVMEAYDRGTRVFENVDISFAQLGGFTLDDVVFKDCTFDYTSFRFSSMRRARFTNCRLFFIGFYGTDLRQAVFDHSTIEFARFDTAQFDETIFRSCEIRYSSLINTALGAATFTDCSKMKVWESVAAITTNDIQDARRV